MEENAGYAIARLDLGGSKFPAVVGSPKFSGKFKFEKDRVFQHLGFFGGFLAPAETNRKFTTWWSHSATTMRHPVSHVSSFSPKLSLIRRHWQEHVALPVSICSLV